jgi:hypothetical protein
MPRQFLFALFLFAQSANACLPTGPSSGSRSSGPGQGSSPSVTVHLINGGTERFAYDGFTNYPTSIRQTGSCTSYSYGKGDLSEMRFNGRTAAACSNNTVYWEFSINMNGRWVTGHWGCGTGCTTSVTGKDLSTGNSKSVQFQNISSIVFNR